MGEGELQAKPQGGVNWHLPPCAHYWFEKARDTGKLVDNMNGIAKKKKTKTQTKS